MRGRRKANSSALRAKMRCCRFSARASCITCMPPVKTTPMVTKAMSTPQLVASCPPLMRLMMACTPSGTLRLMAPPTRAYR
jgi:hypothetical protein